MLIRSIYGFHPESLSIRMRKLTHAYVFQMTMLNRSYKNKNGPKSWQATCRKKIARPENDSSPPCSYCITSEQTQLTNTEEAEPGLRMHNFYHHAINAGWPKIGPSDRPLVLQIARTFGSPRAHSALARRSCGSASVGWARGVPV